MAERPTIRLSTSGLSRPEVIVLLLEAFNKLKWGVEHLHPMRVVATTRASSFSWGEQVILELDDEGFSVTSKYQQWSPLAGRKRLQRNLDKLVDAFSEARISTTPEAMAAELKELEESGVMQQDASTAHANDFQWKDIGTVFIPRRDLWATPLLLDISVLVYILMVAMGVNFMSPTGEELLAWGGNYRPETMDGQWWRLLTACFVHIGLMHLLFNMYALLMVGLRLEPLLGGARVLALYVITGLFASVASLWWHDNTISAGASGAIFGLYGVFLALLTTDLMHKEVRHQLLGSIGIFVVYNLLNGLKGSVDNAAHIGGLLSGLVMGFATYLALARKEIPGIRLGSILLPTALLALAGTVALAPLATDDKQFEARLGSFYDNQSEGMILFEMAGGSASPEELLEELRRRSLPAWYANRALLEDLGKLRLSSYNQERQRLMLAYSELRLKQMDLMQMELGGSFDRTLPNQLRTVEEQINGILAAYNGAEEEE
jgi:rhomboid protease GluP